MPLRRLYPELLTIFVIAWTMFGVTAGHASERESAAVLGVICIAGLFARVIPYFARMTYLELAFSGLMLGYLVVSAVATYNLDRIDAPASGVIWWSIGVRWATVYVLLSWPRWVGRVGVWRSVQ